MGSLKNGVQSTQPEHMAKWKKKTQGETQKKCTNFDVSFELAPLSFCAYVKLEVKAKDESIKGLEKVGLERGSFEIGFGLDKTIFKYICLGLEGEEA